MRVITDIPGRVIPSGDAPGETTFYLHPGHVFVSPSPMLVTTILATCVAVCLWDQAARVGGMNHYLLAWDPPEVDRTARYGPIAFRELLDRLTAHGARRARLQAKVFGGVARRPAEHEPGGERLWRDQGRANSDLAFRLLADERIPIIASDVGGLRARKLRFQTDTGEGWVKYL